MPYLVKFTRAGDDSFFAVDAEDSGDAQSRVMDHCDASHDEAAVAIKELSQSDLDRYECPKGGLSPVISL
jgi:hypothetical protein